MSSLAEIYFNYDKAIQQANKLDEIARKLRTASNSDMDRILKNINAAWKSDSAPAYIKKGNKVGSDIVTSAKNLERIASTIRRIAQEIRDAELAAWEIANARN